jgi:4-hydroxy-tetrahydrodipicolinate reductase
MPAPSHRLALFGATGRMGQSILQALRAAPQWQLVAAVASAGSPRLGQDASADGCPSGVLVGSDPLAALAGAAAAVDFSLASAVGAHAAACAAAGVPLLVGTTGLDEAALQSLRLAATRIPVLVAPNTSVGVGVLAELAAVATRALGPDFDVEILEAHHRAKRDAPSGTALKLGEAVATVRGQALSEVAALDRASAAAARLPGSIGFAVVRAADIVGEHTVIFATQGERLELTHRATDRLTFARGALRAAAWLVGRAPGYYRMENVLREA